MCVAALADVIPGSRERVDQRYTETAIQLSSLASPLPCTTIESCVLESYDMLNERGLGFWVLERRMI